MSSNNTSYEEFKEMAKRQLDNLIGPSNGGGSLVDFYEALGEVGTNIAKVPLIVSFPKRRVD